MTENEKDLLLKDLCARLPYGVKVLYKGEKYKISNVSICNETITIYRERGYPIEVEIKKVKPYLFPLSSMTDEDFAIYFKIWEDTGNIAYLEGCHPLIINIKAYKVAIDYLLSKHYDVNGLIPKGLAIDATGLNIY